MLTWTNIHYHHLFYEFYYFFKSLYKQYVDCGEKMHQKIDQGSNPTLPQCCSDGKYKKCNVNGYIGASGRCQGKVKQA